MKIEQLKPDDIYLHLTNRLSKTNKLFEMLDGDSPMDLCNIIFFKYYFDISTAIEAIIRGIIIEESKKNTYIEYLAEPYSSNKACLIKYEELKKLIKIESLYENIEINDFKTNFYDKIVALDSLKRITKSFKNDGTFKEDYHAVRSTRNILAHGLAAMQSIDYSPTMLETFLYVQYLLFNYYSLLIRKNRDDKI